VCPHQPSAPFGAEEHGGIYMTEWQIIVQALEEKTRQQLDADEGDE
jgi:hypothetical protein